MPKWMKDGDAQQYLEGLFESGELGEKDKPKDVYDKYAGFREYSMDVFRKKISIMKKEYINLNHSTVTPETKNNIKQQSNRKGEFIHWINAYTIF